MSLFAFGFLGVIVSIGRVIYIFVAGYGTVIGLVEAWTVLEQTVGIVICCLPALRSLIDKSVEKARTRKGTVAAENSTGQSGNERHKSKKGFHADECGMGWNDEIRLTGDVNLKEHRRPPLLGDTDGSLRTRTDDL